MDIKPWPPSFLPGPPSPTPVPSRRPTADLADASLLVRLAEFSNATYTTWTPATFTADIAATGDHAKAFPRAPGKLAWRVLPLLYMPLSYFCLIFSFLSVLLLVFGVLYLLAAGAGDMLQEPWIAADPFAFAGNALFWLFAYAPCVLAVLGLVVGVVLVIAPRWASAHAYGFVDRETGSPIVVFTGSKSYGVRRDDLCINGGVWPLLFPMRHLGFHRAWWHISGDVTDWLRTLPPGAPVILCGHSLGGALATIAAYDLSREFAIGHVVPFGSSRIGGKTLRERYKERSAAGGKSLHDVTRQIRRARDAIPRLPPALLFRYVGRGFCLSDFGPNGADRVAVLAEQPQQTIFAEYLLGVCFGALGCILWVKYRVEATRVMLGGIRPELDFAPPSFKPGMAMSPAPPRRHRPVVAIPALVEARPYERTFSYCFDAAITELRRVRLPGGFNPTWQVGPLLPYRMIGTGIAAFAALLIFYAIPYYAIALVGGMTTGHRGYYAALSAWRDGLRAR